MFNLKQFILWISVPNMPPKKPSKVPCDINGRNIDPHDPSQHMTHQEAKSHADRLGYNVGFVLTENDPYFLLDLDDIRKPDGTWDDFSNDFCSNFPGAAMEVSINGNGVHIMGRCDKSKLRNKRNKFADNKAEFYIGGRFVALGHGFEDGANFLINWTDQLTRMVPDRPENHNTVVDLQGVDPAYTFKGDDEQLIAKMRASGGSIASQFGDKASFDDLWDCNVTALAKHFPSPSGDDFDHSSADAALLSHLAFWTGKDFKRMDVLFRRSGLMRDKWDRRLDGSSSDYRYTSISGAIKGCRNVYSVTQTPQQEQKQAAISSGEIMPVQDQIEYFKDCVYVANSKRILVPSGDYLDYGQFNAVYGGYEFLYRSSGGTGTKKAFDAFTENMMHKFPKVADTTFRADLPFQEIVRDMRGRELVNVYKPRNPRAIHGDPSPFVNFVKKLLPSEHDYNVLISYMAAVAQYPGRKFLWAPVVIGTQGNGKSTLINILQYVVDGIVQGVNDDETQYSNVMTAKHIDDKFNSDMLHKIICVVHEMHSENQKDQRSRQDQLKQLITEASIKIEAKGRDKFTARNVANFFFCSNHRDAVVLEQNERRFAVFYTAQKEASDLEAHGMTPQFFEALWKWLRADGFAICNHFLKTMQISYELDPTKGAQRAPITSSKNEALWESRTNAEQMILQAIEQNEQGFRGGWVSTLAVKKLFILHGEKPPYGRGLSTILKRLGFTKGVLASSHVLKENGRPTLWVRDGMNASDVKAYEKTQGYEQAPNIKMI